MPATNSSSNLSNNISGDMDEMENLHYLKKVDYKNCALYQEKRKIEFELASSRETTKRLQEELQRIKARKEEYGQHINKINEGYQNLRLENAQLNQRCQQLLYSSQNTKTKIEELEARVERRNKYIEQVAYEYNNLLEETRQLRRKYNEVSILSQSRADDNRLLRHKVEHLQSELNRNKESSNAESPVYAMDLLDFIEETKGVEFA
jgi:methyl-accepting chemotaxis protein